jgi:hypothetical protein
MPDESRLCSDCGKEKSISSFPLSSTGYRGWGCSACAAKANRRRSRLKVLTAFGGKCSCCGEDHPYFLHLEHINGRQYGKFSKPSYAYYVQVIKDNYDPKKYTLLCANCNLAKGFYGECPHKSGITKESVMGQLLSEAAYKDRSLVGKSKGQGTGYEGAALHQMLKKSGVSLAAVLEKIKK